MKAKIKHTEKIIDVEWTMYGWVWDSPEGRRCFDQEELIFLDNDNFDWQSFRTEAAKDFTVAILSNPRWSEHFKATDKDFRFDEAYYKKVVIGNALSYTDELIKQLKEKEA